MQYYSTAALVIKHLRSFSPRANVDAPEPQDGQAMHGEQDDAPGQACHHCDCGFDYGGAMVQTGETYLS
jgi:hypothetical protein